MLRVAIREKLATVGAARTEVQNLPPERRKQDDALIRVFIRWREE